MTLKLYDLKLPTQTLNAKNVTYFTEVVFNFYPNITNLFGQPRTVFEATHRCELNKSEEHDVTKNRLVKYLLTSQDSDLTKFEICSEMHGNEMHELYDRYHKLSPNLNSSIIKHK